MIATKRASLTGMIYATLAIIGCLAFALVMLSFLVPACLSIFPAFAGTSGAGVSGAGDARSFGAAASMTASAVKESLAVGRLFAAFRFTLTEALLSAVAAIAIGLPAAFLVARRDFPGRRALLALSGVPLCIPPMIIALAFVLFYGRQGYLNTFLMRFGNWKEPPVTFLYSLAGVVIAHGFYNFPVVLRTVSQVWERLPEAEEDAARLLGASPLRIFRTITLPRLSGAILASAALVFLYCFFSFIIVLLFGGIGGTTLEVELYQAARSSFDFHLAGTIALVETISALCIVVLYIYLQKRLSEGTAALTTERKRIKLSGFGEMSAAVFYFAFILVFFIGPLTSILVRSFLQNGSGAFSGVLRFGTGAWTTLIGRTGFLPALGTTVLVGLAVALLSSCAALFFALARRKRGIRGLRGGQTLSRIIPMAPLAVSSVILGFGWTLLVPRGNAIVLVLAQSAMAWPFAWTQIQGALDRIPRSVHDASMILSPGQLNRSFRVLIPLSYRGILSGAGFAFAISAGDASLPLVLSLTRFENLSLMLFRLVGSYRFSEACACAVVLAALSGAVFFLQDGKAKYIKEQD